MKHIILFAFFITVFLSLVACKNNLKTQKQITLSQDNGGFQAELNQIVARAPTIEVSHRIEPTLTPQKESTTIDISNSNTSTLPNVGSLGKTAEIVYPHIDLVSKTPISVVSSAPAQLGTRTENTLITSLNKGTGKIEQHEISKETPIIGTVNKVETVYQNQKASYDTFTKSFHQSKPTFTRN